jgi:twinkle protein
VNYLATHVGCDDCGSSDALSVSVNDKGETWSHCFACGTNTKMSEHDDNFRQKHTKSAKVIPMLDGKYQSIPLRNLSRDALKAFGVMITDEGGVAFPYCDADGKVTAYKIRHDAMKTDCTIKGDWSKATLFGQHLFSKGGKSITITEGEFDAVAVYQMNGMRYPVVSIRNGAQSALKDCKDNYEFINSFETIVISFDADEVGKQAATKVADLFGAKAKIVKHRQPYKDANDYLKDEMIKEYIQDWFAAEVYVPDGIIEGSKLWEEINTPAIKASCDYPWQGMNALTYGIRKGELVTFTAGSGLGKSQVLREIVYHILCKTEDNIGLMFLEESTVRTAKGIMSIHANKPLHLPDTAYTDEEFRDAFEHTLGTNRVYLFDHFGSTSIDNILSRVRFMAKGLGCSFVVLDHISIVVSSGDVGDERKALDEIMTKLRMIVQETGIALLIVSHLKRPDGKGHEEGAATSLGQLRGSGSIAQLSDMVIGMERNAQHDDERERNTTRIRVLKNRFSGVTGPACNVYYSHTTGRLSEVTQDEDL